MSIVKAILSLRPGAEFSLSDKDDYSTIIWHTPDINPPSESEVMAEIARLNQEAADKKAAAESKLEAIGLTVDDLKALFS